MCEFTHRRGTFNKKKKHSGTDASNVPKKMMGWRGWFEGGKGGRTVLIKRVNEGGQHRYDCGEGCRGDERKRGSDTESVMRRRRGMYLSPKGRKGEISPKMT